MTITPIDIGALKGGPVSTFCYSMIKILMSFVLSAEDSNVAMVLDVIIVEWTRVQDFNNMLTAQLEREEERRVQNNFPTLLSLVFSPLPDPVSFLPSTRA